jgi:hypothetical protein
MHGNIILVLESNIKLLPVTEDIDSDVKVSCPDLVLLKECVKVIGWRKRTVVEPDTDDTLRSIIYVTGIATTV